MALAASEIIVSDGRGLGAPQNLALVHDLADALGGAVGVSLALVDMGWAPHAMQVGQTGAVVAPRLYVACGISGQVQHKIGIERSGTIVAINTDRDADHGVL
jgi:electron transfer flavoprotein alpha subunit